MNKPLFVRLLVYCSVILLLTGCWDQINIEDHGFVTGVAIDKLDDNTHDHERITVMNQFVIPAKLGDVANGGGEAKPFTNLSASGSSLFEIGKELSSLTAHQPFYEHMKIIVFSEELAKEPGMFDSLSDVFIRYQEMRRATRILIAGGKGGKASDILDIEPETNKIPAMYIDSLVENSKVNLELLAPVKLGDLHSFLLKKDGFAIPHAIPLENRIQADGVSVFSGYDNQLVGKLDKEETKGLNLITDTNKGGAIKFYINDHLMDYSIDHTTSSIKIDAADQDNIDIHVHIEAKGSIVEMFGDKSLLNETYMDEMEKEINKRIEYLATETIEKAQNDLKVDFLGFSKYLRKKHYSTWKHIKDDWDRGDDLFSTSDITVSANSAIISIGASDRAKVKRNE